MGMIINLNSFGSDNDSHFESFFFAVQIIFQTARISNSSFRVINKTNQRLTVWVSLIFLNINDELFSNLSCIQSFPSLFYFDYSFFLFEEKIHSGTASSIAWCPFFRTNIIKIQMQKRVKKVLRVVFIFDFKRRSIIVTLAKLPRN